MRVGSLVAIVWLLGADSAFAQFTVVRSDLFRLNTGPCTLQSGNGSPEGVRVGKICDTYLNTVDGVLWEKWTGINTNTGWNVGHNTNARVNGDLNITGYVGAPGYVSQLSKWRITEPGAGDFRYLFTDELHAKLFIADLEQALAGGQIICKSVSMLGANFTNPAAGGSATMIVKDLPSGENISVFQPGDYVGVRAFTRSAGSLTIGETFGVVTDYSDQPGGVQAWTFNRGSGANGGGMPTSTVVAADAIVIDYGVSGNGCHEVNAIDGFNSVNSPYAQTWRWTTSPISSNRVISTRVGNLRGVTGAANDYGMFAGTGDLSVNGQMIVASSATGMLIRNLTLEMYSGGVNTMLMNPTVPSFAIGSAVPTAYGTGIGIWMGNDGGTYKFRVGNPAGSRVTWDGTTLSVVADGGGLTNINGANVQTGTITAAKLTVGSGINLIRNSDCGASVDDWGIFTNTGLVQTIGRSQPFGAIWSLDSGPSGCQFGVTGTPIAGQASQSFLTTLVPGQQGFKYEASVYLVPWRTNTTVVQLQFVGATGGVLATASGNSCAANEADVRYLQNYCRSAVLATAPSGTASIRVLVTTTHSAELDPFVFWVHTFLGEALANQTEFSPWGPAGVTEIIGGLIKTGTIVAGHIAANTITAAQIAAGTITATQIATGTITATQIAANTITAAKIAAGTITATEIATNTITANKISANAITASELAADSVNTSELAAGSVTAGKISVSSLSAITANIGTITTGTLNGVDVSTIDLHVGDGQIYITTMSSTSGTHNPVVYDSGNNQLKEKTGNLNGAICGGGGVTGVATLTLEMGMVVDYSCF